MSPALTGRFLCTVPPGKSNRSVLCDNIEEWDVGEVGERFKRKGATVAYRMLSEPDHRAGPVVTKMLA